jgi:hypothetical protein
MTEQEPVFRVIRGTPTAEELAALVGAFVVRTRSASPSTPPPVTPAWVRAARPGVVGAGGLPGRPGADGWRLSGLPR